VLLVQNKGEEMRLLLAGVLVSLFLGIMMYDSAPVSSTGLLTSQLMKYRTLRSLMNLLIKKMLNTKVKSKLQRKFIRS